MAGETGDLALSLLRPSAKGRLPSPVDVLALAGPAQAAVRWRFAAVAAVQSVTIIASPSGASVTVPVKGVTGSAVITGLANGTAYTFRVVANGAAPSSLPSAPSNTVKPTALAAATLPLVDGLEYWFSAGQLGLNDGAAVTSMLDISGNGYDALPEAAGATFKAAWSGGKPAIVFPGTGARFTTKASGLVAGMRGQSATIYLLYSVAATVNAGGVKGGRILSAETPYSVVSTGYAEGFAVAPGYADTTRTAAVVDRSPGILGQGVETLATPTALDTPVQLVACRPGPVEVNGAPLGVNLQAAFDLRRLNRRDRLSGANTSNEDTGYVFGSQMGGRFNQHFQGALAEVLIFARTHTAAERALMRAYLQTRM